jgi:ketosteroid isomerase-like protein
MLEKENSQADANMERLRHHDRVVQVGRTRGHLVATGKEFDIAEALVWTIRDGKVVRAEFYIDTPAQLAALSA